MTQITDWIRQNPTAGRWTLIGLIAVVVIVLLGSQSWNSPQSVSLFDSRQLTTDEIGLMQVAFGKSGLNEYEIRGHQIEVPKSSRGDYLKSLSDHGAIPQDLTANMEADDSFEFFQTRAQQRSRQLARKKQTIRDMVMQLRFVDRAMVDYDETRGATPFDEMQRTAIVNVTPIENRVLTLPQVKAIRDTVRGAVAGLEAENITIIDTFGSKSHTGLADVENARVQPHTLAQMQAEKKYETKIRSALTAYPGIRVNVDVGVDPVVRRIRDERNVQGQPVVFQATVHREFELQQPSTKPSLMQSVFDLGANSQARIEPNQQTLERATETTRSVANGTFQTTESAGPIITYVNVSIGIPERCVRFFVQQRTQGEQLTDIEARGHQEQVLEQLRQDIQQKVRPLVPFFAEQADSRNIVVTLDREIPVSIDPEPAAAGLSNITWHWSWFLLIAVGLLGIGFWNPGKKRNESRHRNGASEPAHGFRAPVAIADRVEQAGYRRDQEPSADIRQQLDQWCRQNPDATTDMIRQWLDRRAG